jgi:hypothetical protein
LTQAQAVKQAWAISYSKERKGEKLGATKKAAPTKVKAKKASALAKCIPILKATM